MTHHAAELRTSDNGHGPCLGVCCNPMRHSACPVRVGSDLELSHRPIPEDGLAAVQRFCKARCALGPYVCPKRVCRDAGRIPGAAAARERLRAAALISLQIIGAHHIFWQQQRDALRLMLPCLRTLVAE